MYRSTIEEVKPNGALSYQRNHEIFLTDQTYKPTPQQK